jgi:hypothetical protein
MNRLGKFKLRIQCIRNCERTAFTIETNILLFLKGLNFGKV